ncbi:hypothetical protein HKD37_01G001063 [Glycine soja]
MAKIQGPKEGKPILIFTKKNGPNLVPWAQKSTLRFMRILGPSSCIFGPIFLESSIQCPWR